MCNNLLTLPKTKTKAKQKSQRRGQGEGFLCPQLKNKQKMIALKLQKKTNWQQKHNIKPKTIPLNEYEFICKSFYFDF